MIYHVKCLLKIQEYHPYIIMIMNFVLFLYYIIGEMHQTGIGRVGGSKTELVFILELMGYACCLNLYDVPCTKLHRSE